MFASTPEFWCGPVENGGSVLLAVPGGDLPSTHDKQGLECWHAPLLT